MFGEQSLFKIQGYKVVRQLAEGSFGQICEIIDTKTNKNYALKALLKSYLTKTDTINQARLQALLLETLDHPGIVKLYELKEDDDFLYLIMELGGRGDLKDLLSKTITPEQWKPQTKKTLAQILGTICYLHANGIVHCDIKAQNIVVMNKGNPKLVDFGTARIFDSELLSAEIVEKWENYVCTQKIIGSPEYISPQGIKGQVSPARDIWAFGVLAYWIFHGKFPFSGQSHLDLFDSIQNSQPEYQQTLGEEAKQLLRDCLRKNPNTRPTAIQLKFYPYFQQIDFKHIFSQKAKPKQKTLFQCNIEKKMFFGNFKARFLKITIQDNQLYLSYGYPNTGFTKNKFKLQPSDFAQQENEYQFFVRTKTDKYHFKASTENSTHQCINVINEAIKNFYEL